MDRNKPSNGLEIAVINIVSVPDVSDVRDLSQDRINVAIDRRILDTPQSLAGHGNAEDRGNLIDKIVGGL
jgi:hypothetical protein